MNRAPSAFILTRPLTPARINARWLRAQGCSVLLAPMQRIIPAPITDELVERMRAADALLFTSANAVPMLAEWPELHAIAACAVGRQTAMAVRRAGFGVELIGDGDITTMAARLADHAKRSGWRRLVHVSGCHRSVDSTELFASLGISVQSVPVYEAVLAEYIPIHVVRAIRLGRARAVLFFSARAAHRFDMLLGRVELPGSPDRAMIAYCLSARIAAALDVTSNWHETHVSGCSASLLQMVVRNGR